MERAYKFGAVEVVPAERKLLIDGRPVEVGSRAFDTLLMLIRHRGEAVTKENLMDTVWQGVIVEENNLHVQIAALRKLLGAGAIATLPGRGYQFTLAADPEPPQSEPKEMEAPGKGPPASRAEHRFSRRAGLIFALVLFVGAGLWLGRREMTVFFRSAETHPAATGIRSMAIPPFQVLNRGAADDDYLGLGMADALITSLGNVREITVRPTSSIVRYSSGSRDALAIGREQGVDAVLEGTIQRAGQRLRLSVRLLRVSDGGSVWASHFDEDLSDVFRLQDSIAEQVVRALVLRLTSEQRARLARRYTDNVKAYQLYLKGLYQWNRFNEEGFRNSIKEYEEALKLDPNYALAYVGISQAYSAMAALGVAKFEEAVPKANAASEKAISLDSGLAEAHQAMGGNMLLLQRDFEGAARELNIAISINPSLAEAHSLYGYYLQIRGRLRESVDITRRAVDLNPLSPLLRVDLSSAYYYAGDLDMAIEEFERALEIDAHFTVPFFVAGQALERKGARVRAIKRCEEALKVVGRDPGVLAALAYALAASGQRDAAVALGKELERTWEAHPFPPSALVLVYISLEDRPRAIRWLETAYRVHDTQLLWLALDPQFEPLRSDTKAMAIFSRMGLKAALASPSR